MHTSSMSLFEYYSVSSPSGFSIYSPAWLSLICYMPPNCSRPCRFLEKKTDTISLVRCNVLFSVLLFLVIYSSTPFPTHRYTPYQKVISSVLVLSQLYPPRGAQVDRYPRANGDFRSTGSSNSYRIVCCPQPWLAGGIDQLRMQNREMGYQIQVHIRFIIIFILIPDRRI